MKSSLRSLVAVVLAILAGTFFSVRGYLGTLEASYPRVASGTPNPFLVGSDVPGSVGTPEAAPARVVPVPEPDAKESVQDDNCPTCAATSLDDGLKVLETSVRPSRAAS